MDDRLQRIYDEAGRPGAQAFRFAVRRAGLQLSDAEQRAFVSRQSVGQVFRGRIPSDGKIVGGGREDQRWQMDLIDFSKKIAKLNNQHKYVLIAVDLYSREAFTQPLQRKTAQTTLEAFRKIIRTNGGASRMRSLLTLEPSMHFFRRRSRMPTASCEGKTSKLSIRFLSFIELSGS